jgi:hypothetical protein
LGITSVLNVDVLIFILYFITPGVITIKTKDLIIPADQRKWGEMFLELVSYSAINLCIYYLLLASLVNHFVPVINLPTFISSKEIDYRTILFGSFILPILIGFLSSVIPRWTRFQKFFHGIILHPEPSAWDALFADRKKCYIVFFYFKTDAKVAAGLYGDKSYVSSFPHPKEIYVQQLCKLDKDGQILGMDEKSAGAFISIDECILVEFFHVPLVKRRNLWQKIMDKIIGSCSQKLHRGSKKSSKEKDEVLLGNQTLAASFRLEATLSPSKPQIQEAKAVQQPPQIQEVKATQQHPQIQEAKAVQQPPQMQEVNAVQKPLQGSRKVN